MSKERKNKKQINRATNRYKNERSPKSQYHIKKIKVKIEGNFLLREILIRLNIKENLHIKLREAFATIIEEVNYNEERLTKMDLADNSFQEIHYPFRKLLHLIIKVEEWQYIL